MSSGPHSLPPWWSALSSQCLPRSKGSGGTLLPLSLLEEASRSHEATIVPALVDQPLLYTLAEDYVSGGVTKDWWGHVGNDSNASCLLCPGTASSLTSGWGHHPPPIQNVIPNFFHCYGGGGAGRCGDNSSGGWRPWYILLNTMHIAGGWLPAVPTTETPSFKPPREGPGPVASSFSPRPASFPAQDGPLSRMTDSGNIHFLQGFGTITSTESDVGVFGEIC